MCVFDFFKDPPTIHVQTELIHVIIQFNAQCVTSVNATVGHVHQEVRVNQANVSHVCAH